MALLLHGVSRESFVTLRRGLPDLLSGTRGTPEQSPAAVGDDLFAVVDMLDHEGRLRRALSDPSRDAAARAGLAQAVLGGRIGPVSTQLIGAVAGERWSGSIDMVDALESLAVETVLIGAEREGRIDEVEDELFRFARIVAGQPPLRSALSNPALPAQNKRNLLDSLLEERAAPETARLVRQAALFPRGRTVERLLEEYGTLAAGRRDRLVAHVTSAIELTDQQRTRLEQSLRRIYGHNILLDVAVDPSVVGGLRVHLGEEEVDGTIAARLDEARRRVAG